MSTLVFTHKEALDSYQVLVDNFEQLQKELNYALEEIRIIKLDSACLLAAKERKQVEVDNLREQLESQKKYSSDHLFDMQHTLNLQTELSQLRDEVHASSLDKEELQAQISDMRKHVTQLETFHAAQVNGWRSSLREYERQKDNLQLSLLAAQNEIVQSRRQFEEDLEQERKTLTTLKLQLEQIQDETRKQTQDRNFRIQQERYKYEERLMGLSSSGQ